jgi:cell division septation protein DedD
MQFSVAVSVVVFIAAGTFLFGYKLGIDAGLSTTADNEGGVVVEMDQRPANAADSASDADTKVTFYHELTRRDKTAALPVPDPEPAKETRPASGTAPEPGKKDEEASARNMVPAPRPSGDPLMIQVASYPERPRADSLLSSLSGSGYSGTVLMADLGERGVWYRVRIGPFYGKTETDRILSILKEEKGLKGYIVK